MAPASDECPSTELFLETCVRVLKENRPHIVCMFKQLEESQCKKEATNTFKKMIEGIQEDAERTSQQLSSRTKKLEENIMFIANLAEDFQKTHDQKRRLKRKRPSTASLPVVTVEPKTPKLVDPRKTKLSKNDNQQQLKNNHLILPTSTNVVSTNVKE